MSRSECSSDCLFAKLFLKPGRESRKCLGDGRCEAIRQRRIGSLLEVAGRALYYTFTGAGRAGPPSVSAKMQRQE
jgi:hypothetical protein